MTWNAPATGVTGQVVTAAFWNAQIRDNFLETSAATATTAGDLVYADASNSMGSRLAIGAAGSVLVSTGTAPVWRVTTGTIGGASYSGTSTSFAPFDGVAWGSGTSVNATLVTGTKALVWYGARSVANATAGARVLLSVAVTGATTIAAAAGIATDDESSAVSDLNSPGRVNLFTGLTGGTNGFQLQGSVTAGTGTVASPYIAVLGL
jgi:hypothetical protein